MSLSPEEHAQQIINNECQEKTGVLNLNNLGLTEMPEAIADMDWLKVLNFSNSEYWDFEEAGWEHVFSENKNIIKVIPEWIKNLSNLETLNCDDSQVEDLNPIIKLQKLRVLFIDSSFLTNIEPLSHLSKLTEVTCNSSKTSSLNALINLENLQSIWCNQTQINDLAPLAGLSKLQSISCNETQVSDLAPLAGLSKLKTIYCYQTQVSDLAPLAGLSKLQTISCNQTQVSDLSPLLSHLKQGTNILYPGCPLIIPPIEFANQGDQAVIEYLEQIEEKSTKLNELKVIFLGEGASGKTSLIKRLRKKDFNPKEDQTHGIRIRKTDFKVEGDTISAHLWDFGGQEVMHATHQFFLSERCIYVLVLNSRTDDKAEYWLKHAASFGGNSPVLIVLNKIDENPSFDVNRKVLNEKYPQIKGYFPLSCQTELGIGEFKQALLAQMALSDARRTPFPDSWLAVKKQFECMDDDYIESQRYQEICEKSGLDKAISQDVLLQFLHDLGLVINFRNLQNFDTQILNPLWLTNGVYRIINSEIVIKNKGILHEDKFDNVVNDPRYKKSNTCETDYVYPREKLSYIVRIMQEFELCYPLDHKRYVIPQLLPVAEPDFKFEGASIHFEVKFPEFLPDSIFPRLMVKLHEYIDDGLQWRTGVVLHKPLIFDAKARIRADKEDKKISIDLWGNELRRLLSFIRATLKEIIKDFSKLEFKEMIAIPHDNEQIILREYAEIAGYEEMDEKEIAIVELRKRVSIKDILDGVEEPSMRDEIAQTPIKAFISYSHLDHDGLLAAKSALAPYRRLNNLKLWCDHAIDAGDTWEKEIFKQLEEADIVLCLISQDFINSDFCHRELETALENHAQGEQIVVPILWRECNWDDLPIATLQAASSKWIKSQSNMDVAWTEVSKKLKPVIEQAKKRRIEKNREMNHL